eukprot:CAMPEP_0202728732 /NCGR_PEP_ID=MMETSP1385-20130828/185775_1 /ASSEMBLY_ACC=CAM_ASM_000861 /TAXON_ID=933848 /ORGANISM="Elphidium margaritaceum" /LENGTH=2035 /DNA_ID=CAMNT_0049394983 /DNA_START=78 /DNA_END=6186 /DNA_ORIENTATION=+
MPVNILFFASIFTAVISQTHCFEIPDVGDNIVYVRKTGCDFGYCQSPNTEYETCSIPTAAPSLRRRALLVTEPDLQRRRLASSLSGCGRISVEASLANTFDGEYLLQTDTLMFEKQVWKTGDGRRIVSVVDRWVIVGLNGEMLAHSVTDALALSPPAGSADWMHSAQDSSQSVQVELVCLDTPLEAPADWEAFAACPNGNRVYSTHESMEQTPMSFSFSLSQQAALATYIEKERVDCSFFFMMGATFCSAAYGGAVPSFLITIEFANGSAVLEQPEILHPNNSVVTSCASAELGAPLEHCDRKSSIVVWRDLPAADYTIDVTVVNWTWPETNYDASVVLRCGYFTQRPTTDPTAAPTFSPVATPTSSPTATSSSPTTTPANYFDNSTCSTLEYAANCLFGRGGSPSTDIDCGATGADFNGNGVIEVGAGDWFAPEFLDDDWIAKKLIIRAAVPQMATWWFSSWPGDSSRNTSVTRVRVGGAYSYLMFDGLILNTTTNPSVTRVRVGGAYSYLMFDGLILNTTYESSAISFEVAQGATLHFKDVWFSGNGNLHGWIWHVASSKLILENCRFTDSPFFVSATDTSSVFVAGSVFEHVSSISGQAMFEMSLGNFIFSVSDSRFAYNTGRLAFLHERNYWYHSGRIMITNSSFIGNQHADSDSFIVHFVDDEWFMDPSTVTVAGCTFEGNVMNGGQADLFRLTGWSVLEITDSIFQGNTARYEIYMLWHSGPDPSGWGTAYSDSPELFIRDSLFVNGSQSVYVESGTIRSKIVMMSVRRTKWTLYERLISTGDSYVNATFSECEFLNLSSAVVPRPTDSQDNFYFADCLFAYNQWGASLFESRGGRIQFVNTNFTANQYTDSLVILHKDAVAKSVQYPHEPSVFLIDGCILQHDDQTVQTGPVVIARSQENIDIAIRNTDFGNACSDSHCLQFNETRLTIDRASIASANSLLFDFPAALYLEQFTAGDSNTLDYIRNGINFTGFDPADSNAAVFFEPCTQYMPSIELPQDTNTTGQFMYDQVGQLSEGLWSCSSSETNNTNGCHLKCTAKLSCVLSELTITQSETASISCGGDRSCWDNIMHIESASNASITCREENSCKDSKLTLVDIGKASIECLEASSCDSMSVQLFNVQNISVKCYHTNACDNIVILSDSDTVDLTMYSYSENVQITVPNEFKPEHMHSCIYDDAYLNLAGDTYLNVLVEEELTAFYQAHNLSMPCNASVTYSFTESGKASCYTQYRFTELPAVLSNFPEFMQCLPFSARNLYDIECIGTWAPTTDPTQSPTVEPTADPSKAPTKNPTSSPSSSPTTATPTKNPTADPTKDPTADPTHDPTVDPTVDPTADPTTDPTLDPTRGPTEDPTYEPTVDPTNGPTADPTMNPTLNPTSDPTTMPTREPTEADMYDSYFDVQYAIQNWTLSAIEQFASNVSSTASAMTTMIERGYQQNRPSLILRFDDFWIQLVSINGVSVSEWSYSSVERAEVVFVRSKQRILFDARVLCSELKCDHIVKDYNQAQFEAFVTEKMRLYFGVSAAAVNAAAPDTSESESLQFKVLSQSEEAMALNAEEESTSVNYGFLGALGVSGILMLIAWCACCYNSQKYWPFKRKHCCGCKTVDDGKYRSLIVFALHFYDFASDINLALEICFNLFLTASINGYDNVSWMLMVCACGSVSFIVIPYTINVYYASKVKEMVNANESANTWFIYNSKIFTALVVLSGGCYASLQLISSNIFGLPMLSCGLTQYELSNRKVANIRFVGNVLCENVPQLFVQLLYATYIGTVNQALMFAFTASLISVMNHSLGYCIDRKMREEGKNIVAVYYYLIMRCEKRTAALPANSALEDAEFGIGAVRTAVPVLPASPSLSWNVSGVARVKLTKKERKSITKNMGRRLQLTSAMAELFGINQRYIQIASTTLTTQGFISHIVHCVNRLEIGSAHSSPQHYIDEMYQSVQLEIDDVFRTHYNLSGDFKVECQHHLTMMNRIKSVRMGRTMASDIDEEFEEDEGANGGAANGVEMATAAGDVADVENNKQWPEDVETDL